MEAKRTIGIAARVLMGAVFVASAVTKYLSIDAVDMFVFEHKLFSWNVTQFLTRFLVGFEAFVGLSLIAGVCQRLVRWLAIGSLAFFTLYVLLKPVLFDVSDENCHCFGTMLILSDGQTIVKNVILLALSYFLFWQQGLKQKWCKWLCLGLFVAGTATAYTIKAPDLIVYSLYDKSASLDMEKFDLLLKNEGLAALNVEKGRKVLCLYSTGCKHCKRTAIKLNVMIERHALAKEDFVVAFWGNEKNIDKFYSSTDIERLPSFLVPAMDFLSATKGRQPLVVLLEDGKVVDLFKSITLDEEKIVDFLK